MNRTYALVVLLALSGCSPRAPSAGDIQTALAETQQAMPTQPKETEAPKPTLVQTQVPQPPQTTRPLTTPATSTDLCDWFIKTQFLRAQRLGGLSGFNEWYNEHGREGLASSDYSVRKELVTVLKEYRPYEEQFIKDWTELGAHPEAQEFWEKELAAVQRQIQAFDEMIEGFEKQDMDKYDHGLTVFFEAADIGRKGEDAMIKIRSKCLP